MRPDIKVESPLREAQKTCTRTLPVFFSARFCISNSNKKNLPENAGQAGPILQTRNLMLGPNRVLPGPRRVLVGPNWITSTAAQFFVLPRRRAPSKQFQRSGKFQS